MMHKVGMILFVLSWWGAALSGCDSAPRAANEYDGTTADEIASNRDPSTLSGPVDPNASAGPRVLVELRVAEFPILADLEPAWAEVNTAAFPGLTHGAWRANGLRLGLLDADRGEVFTDALPAMTRPLSQRSMLLTGSPQPALRSPRLNAQAVVDLTRPPMQRRVRKVSGGRLQLLIHTEPSGLADAAELEPSVALVLSPHHHVPQATLLPRGPLEKALDGKVFEDLALRVQVPRNKMLVLALEADRQADRWRPTRPIPEASEPTEMDAEDPSVPRESSLDSPEPEPATQPSAENSERDPEPLVIVPHRMGRWLLAGQVANRPVQRMVFLRVLQVQVESDPAGQASAESVPREAGAAR